MKITEIEIAAINVFAAAHPINCTMLIIDGKNDPRKPNDARVKAIVGNPVLKPINEASANKAYDTNPEIIKVVDAVYIPAAAITPPMYHVPLLALAPTQVANISQFDIVRLSVEIAST